MKINHNFRRGERYFKMYRGVQLDWDEPNYWWDGNIKRWTLTPEWDKGDIGNTFSPCRTVRAFRRRLKEWSMYLPIGTKFRLIGGYVGQDVVGEISNPLTSYRR